MTRATAVHFIGDSEFCVHWMNGTRVINDSKFELKVSSLFEMIENMWRADAMRPRLPFVPFFSHVKRCFNSEADEQANIGIDEGTGLNFVKKADFCVNFIECHFDGGFRDCTSSSGIVIKVAPAVHGPWKTILKASFRINSNGLSDSLNAELHGVQQAILAVMSVLTHDDFYLDGNQFVVPALDFYKPFSGMKRFSNFQ